ncbi:sigma-70 family RNA polymerase sigma factor [Myxococcota bacterium]|nr:sigma-70 family RNA polymerase sigma factor [Myxococcota bacterium]
MSDPVERQLVRRALAGDSSAHRALLARWQGRLWRLAFRAAGDRASAEDLVQDAWMKVLRALPSWREDEPLGPFVHRIAANAACDHVRRRAARPQGDLIPLHLAAAGPDPEAALAGLQRAREVRAALALLPEDQREALVLRHFADLSYDEIALATGRPLGTVKTLIHRGRARLRAALSGEAFEDEWTAEGSRS